MRIVICEDNLIQQTQLKDSLKDWEKARNIDIDVLCYASAEAFLMDWPQTQYDLALLDIEMKQMSGIELAAQIRKHDENIMIVFITSHRQYAIRSYNVNAFHYIVKPLSQSKLLPILDKAYTIWKSNSDASMVVTTEDGLKKLAYNEIFHISKKAHIATVHTREEAYQERKTMDEFEDMLPGHFIRCHRSCIVNLYKVDRLHNDSLSLIDGTKLPVSRNNSKKLREAFVHLYKGH